MDEKAIRKALWENVLAGMQAKYGQENLTKLAADAGVGPGTVSRVKDQGTSVGIEVLARLAQALRIEPYELLIPANDKNLRYFVSIYARTDPEGRRTMATAAQIAEARIDGRAAGVKSPGKADDR